MTLRVTDSSAYHLASPAHWAWCRLKAATKLNNSSSREFIAPIGDAMLTTGEKMARIGCASPPLQSACDDQPIATLNAMTALILTIASQ
jgi:hypothetical protein